MWLSYKSHCFIDEYYSTTGHGAFRNSYLDTDAIFDHFFFDEGIFALADIPSTIYYTRTRAN